MQAFDLIINEEKYRERTYAITISSSNMSSGDMPVDFEIFLRLKNCITCEASLSWEGN
jgi:hypothetical protein